MPDSMEDVVYLKKYKKLLRDNKTSDEDIIQARNERIRHRLSLGMDNTEAMEMELALLDMLGCEYHYGTQRKPKIKTINYSKKAKKFMSFFANTGDIPASESRIMTQSGKLRGHTDDNAHDVSATTGLSITGFVLNGLFLASTPFIYLLAKARGEPVPFDTTDKVRWVISTTLFALGIVTFTVPPVAFVLSLTLISVGALATLHGLVTYVRDRSQLNVNKIIPNQRRIDELSTKIKTNIDQIYDLQYEIKCELKKENPDHAKIVSLESKVNSISVENEKQNETLLDELNKRRRYRIDRSPEKTLFTVLSASAKLMIVGASIAGIVLAANPFTAPIGAIILTTVAAVVIAHYIVSKVHLIRLSRINKESKANLDTEHKHELGLDKISSSLITGIKINPKTTKQELSQTKCNGEIIEPKAPMMVGQQPVTEPESGANANFEKPKLPR